MSEQREGREAIIDILIEHNVGVLNTHGYSDMVEKLEALFSPDAGALEEARELTFAAFQEANVTRCLAAFKHGLDDWSLLEWAGAAAGEMGEVANVCKKLLRQEQGVGGEWAARDPERNELLQALADEIGDTVAYLALLAAAAGIDIGQASASKFDAVSDKVSWDGVRLAALHTGSEPADEAREHVGRALMYVSRALESPEVCASVNRETGGSAPELVQGLLDRITEIWATREWLADLAQAALDATREETAKGGPERRATASDARRALFAGIYGTIEMPRDYVDRTAARYRRATS